MCATHIFRRCNVALLAALLTLLMLLSVGAEARVIVHNVSSFDEAISLVDNKQDRLLFMWDPLDAPSWREYNYLQKVEMKADVDVYAISARSPFVGWMLTPLEVLAYPAYRGVFRNPRSPMPRFEKIDPDTMSVDSFLQNLRRFSK